MHHGLAPWAGTLLGCCERGRCGITRALAAAIASIASITSNGSIHWEHLLAAAIMAIASTTSTTERWIRPVQAHAYTRAIRWPGHHAQVGGTRMAQVLGECS